MLLPRSSSGDTEKQEELAGGVLGTFTRKEQGEMQGKLLRRKPAVVWFIWRDIWVPPLTQPL